MNAEAFLAVVVPVLVLVCAVAVALYWISRRQEEGDVWRAAAETLGLQLLGRGESSGPAMGSTVRPALNELRGVLEGVEVRMTREVGLGLEVRETWGEVRFAPLPAGLVVRPAGVGTALRTMLDGAGPQTGDEAFDRVFAVESDGVEGLAALTAEARAALRRVMTFAETLELRGDALRWRAPSEPRDAAQLVEMARATAAVGRAFGGGVVLGVIAERAEARQSA